MAFPQCGSIAVWPQVFATLLQLIYRWDFWNVHPSSSSGVRELPMHGLSTHLCFPFKMMWTDAKKSGFIFGSQHHHSCCSSYSSHRNFIRVRKRKEHFFTCCQSSDWLISQSESSSSRESVAHCCRFPGNCLFSRGKKRKEKWYLPSLTWVCMYTASAFCKLVLWVAGWRGVLIRALAIRGMTYFAGKFAEWL